MSDLFAARVLAQFGGRLPRIPLLTAIRRECQASLEHAEILLGLAVEMGAVVEVGGWYTLAASSPASEGRLPL